MCNSIIRLFLKSHVSFSTSLVWQEHRYFLLLPHPKNVKSSYMTHEKIIMVSSKKHWTTTTCWDVVVVSLMLQRRLLNFLSVSFLEAIGMLAAAAATTTTNTLLVDNNNIRLFWFWEQHLLRYLQRIGELSKGLRVPMIGSPRLI